MKKRGHIGMLKKIIKQKSKLNHTSRFTDNGSGIIVGSNADTKILVKTIKKARNDLK